MATLPPAAPAAAEASVPAEPSPGVAKALDATVKGLAQLYMECHKADPDSPLCDAVMQLQKATAEIGRNVGMPSASMDAPMPEGEMMPPEEEMMPPMEGEMPPMEEELPPGAEEPLPPGSSIEDASAATHDMMLEAAAKRRSGGSY